MHVRDKLTIFGELKDFRTIDLRKLTKYFRILVSPFMHDAVVCKIVLLQVNAINWFAIIYMVVGIGCGPFIAWLMDKIGLRYSLLLAAWLNCFGALLRIGSALENIHDHTIRLMLAYSGKVTFADFMHILAGIFSAITSCDL